MVPWFSPWIKLSSSCFFSSVILSLPAWSLTFYYLQWTGIGMCQSYISAFLSSPSLKYSIRIYVPILFKIYLMCVSVLRACMYTTCMPSAHGGQTRMSDLLEPELRMMIESHHVCTGNQTPVLWKINKPSLNQQAVSLDPVCTVIIAVVIVQKLQLL